MEEMKPALSTVALVQIEALDPNRATRVLNHCADQCAFGDVMLLSPRPPTIPLNGRWVQVPMFGYIGYSTFSVKALGYFLPRHCSHFLVTQHDGFILNPYLWQADWLQYDYIGAPWPAYHKFGTIDDNRVGNSGFSLRSRAFMTACSEIAFPHNNEMDWPGAGRYQPGVDDAADDVWMCRREEVVHQMRARGLKYAPVEVAKFFASELPIEEEPFNSGFRDDLVFGFHGFEYGDRAKYRGLIK